MFCRLPYIYTFKQGFKGTKAYEETSIDEKTVVNRHLNELPLKFTVGKDRLPMMYWLPKLQDQNT